MHPRSLPPQKTSLWLTRAPDAKRFPALDKNLTTDVVVVGGGIAGVSAAYFLAARGTRVTLLEASHIGTGETGFTTAFLTSSMDTPFFALRERFGNNHIQRARRTGEEGIALVEEVQKKEHLPCGFQRLDAVALGLQPESTEHLTREMGALRLAGGEPTLLRAEEAQTLTGVAAVGAVRIPRQGAFDARTYLLGLGERIQKRGGQVFEETPMTGLDIGKTLVVNTPSATVTTDHVVLTTGLFPNPYRAQNKLFRQTVTYVIALALIEKTRKWRFPNVLAWDVTDPFHYMRFLDELLMIGGEDRPVQEAAKAGEEPWHSLEVFAPILEPNTSWDVTHAWQGQILETSDALPVVGAPPGGDSRVLLASGFGGNGMTLGSYTGKMVADLITGERAADANPFRFERPTLASKNTERQESEECERRPPC